MGFQKLEFSNQDGQRLSARLDLPMDETPQAYAIFAHCFTCSKNLKAVVHTSRALTLRGIAVLRFDFTGLGESEGEFAQTTFTTNVTDIAAAADYLKDHFEAPKLLIGHSLGGAAVIQTAKHIPSCKAVATIGAPADPSDLSGLLMSSKEEIQNRGEVEVQIAGRSFRVNRKFLEELEDVKMSESIEGLDRGLLVLHSPQDRVVPVQNGEKIFAAARHPKAFISLDGADHLLTDRQDARYAGGVLAAWAGRYLGLPEEAPETVNLTDNWVRARIGKTGFQTEILANRHRLLADEPIPAGGADTGPTPYDYLVAALASCTAMTLRMYADRKEWPLEEVKLRLRQTKIHAEDCRKCETEEGKLDRIELQIEPAGPLTDEQRKRLLEIANRCPVHRTLRSETVIESKLRSSAS
jgi:putative redox protein